MPFMNCTISNLLSGKELDNEYKNRSKSYAYTYINKDEADLSKLELKYGK